jgi:hypothetical protein
VNQHGGKPFSHQIKNNDLPNKGNPADRLQLRLILVVGAKGQMNQRVKQLNLVVIVATICIFSPQSVYANIGVPMLVVVWPLSWIAFVPVVAIEAAVARKVVRLSWRKSLRSSLLANAVSTLVGIPVTWGLLVAIEMIISRGGQAFGLKTTLGKVLAVTLQAPWLIPYEKNMRWMLPAAVTFLLPFFGLASVFIERPIFRKWAGCDKAEARQWSWKANALTYGLSILVAIGWLVFGIAVHG